MKCLHIKLTTTVVVYVPEDFPVTDESTLVQAIQWRANDYRDGRYPFATEMMAKGAEGIARKGVEQILFRYITDHVRGMSSNLTRRNAAVERALGHASFGAYSGGAVDVKVEWIKPGADEQDGVEQG